MNAEDEARVEALHPVLRKVVEDELRSGNVVVETWDQYGFGVMLRDPFHLKHDVDSEVVVFARVDDRHYWLAEYRHRDSEQFVACRFGP